MLRSILLIKKFDVSEIYMHIYNNLTFFLFLFQVSNMSHLLIMLTFLTR